jgi:hypothetical protein
MKPIKDQLDEKLPWLFSELGFRVASHSYNPEAFGNSVAVLDSAGLRLKFVRDKGLLTVLVAAVAAPEQWWEFKFVWEFLFGEFPEPELEGYGPLIRRSYGDMAEALGPSLRRTRTELDRRSAERDRSFLEFMRHGRYAPTFLSRVRRTAMGRILTNWPGWILVALLLWLVFRGRGLP